MNTDTLHKLLKSPWIRFAFSIALSFGLMAVFLFAPLILGSAARQSTSDTFTLQLPLKPALVHATGGLTITKSAAVTSAGPGEIITYTLIMTNNTGFPLVNIVITDIVPANTVCQSATAPAGPGKWFATTSPCANESKIEWVNIYNTSLPAPWNEPIPNGATMFFSFTVRVTDTTPLIDQSTITNANYEVAFSAQQSMSNTLAFTDIGPALTTLVNAPTWAITKTASATVQPGDFLTYTIMAENVGHFATSGTYTITDEAPQYTSYVTSTPAAAESGGSLTWTFSDTLPVNGVRVVTYVVQVTEPLTNGISIVNDSYVVTGGNVYTGAIGQAISTTVSGTANLTITKSANPTPAVDAGNLLTYTLTVTNQSGAQSPADNVVISDTLPADTVFQSATFLGGATGSVTNTGSLVQWSLNDPLAVGASAQVQVVARVQSPLPNGSVITNTHSVSASNISAEANGNPVATTINSASDIDGISKTVNPASVIPGGTITYTITITNVGNETATSVSVTDTLDAAFSPSVQTFTNVTVPGRDITGTPGFTTLVFTATAPGLSGVYSNTSITVTNGAETENLGESAPLIVTSPVLSLTKVAATAEISAGDNLAYTLTYTNDSTTPATGVWITDTLPSGVNLVGATPPASAQSGNDVGFNLGTVGAGAGGTVVITVSIPAAVADNTIISNSALITSSENVSDTAGPVLVTVRAPVLNLLKTDASDPVQAGSALTYTLTYSNSGGATAFNAFITDTFDSNAPFADASPAPSPACAPGSAQCSWNVGDLPPTGINQTIVVTVNVASPLTNNTTLTNTAFISSDTRTAQDTETTTVSSSEVLNIIKTGSNGASLVRPGDFITYTITYSNSGNAIAQNTRITDTIDSNTTFQGGTAGYVQVNPTTFEWLVPSLVPSSTFQITLTVRITDSLPSGTVLTNNVVIQSETGVQNNDIATATIQSEPVLHLAKTASADTVEAGGALTYTILYTNTGDAPATGVTITDTLPAQLHLQSANPAPDSGSDPTYVWDIGTVPVGGPFSITLVVTADNIIPNLTQLTNVITMSSVETSTITATKVVTALAVDLQVTKSASVGVVKANDFITYTITVVNNGGATADNVIIADTLPISLEQSSVVSSASAGVVFSGTIPPSEYRWTAATLTGGSSLTVSLSGRLTASPWPATGANFTNTVVVGSDDSEGDFTNNSDDLVSIGRPGDPFTITLTASPTSTLVGNTVVVTATVTDQWGNPAYNGELLTFITSLPGSSIGSPRATQSGIATTTLGSNAPGETLVTGQFPASGISGTTTVTFTTEADLQVSKARVGSGVIIAGDLVTYTITITNGPGSSTVDAVITDAFPAAAVQSVVSCGGCIQGSGALTWTVNGFAATNTQNFTVVLRTSNSYSGTLTNTTGITFSAAFAGATDTDPGNNTDQTIDTVRQPEADLEVTKNLISSNNITIGQPITYTLTVVNNGPDTVTAVITDTFGNATVGSVSNPACGGSGSGPIVCALTNFTGTTVITVALNTGSSVSGTVTNTVTVSPTTGVIDSPSGNNTSSAPNVTVRTPEADLSITKLLISSNNIFIGDQITYTLTVVNNGPDTVNASVTDTFTNATLAGTAGASCGVGNPVLCTLTNFTGTTIITVVLNTGSSISGTVGNSAVVTPTGGAIDNTGGNNSSTAPTVNVEGVVQLGITKTASPASGSDVRPGNTINYQLIISNSGTYTASNVVITDTLDPTGVGFVGGAITGGSGPFASGNTITFSVTSLGTGASVTATVQVTVTASTSGTVINNSAAVNSAETAEIGSNLVSHNVITSTAGGIFLPIILKSSDSSLCADLQVTGFAMLPGGIISATITNSGTCPTDSNFWVDLYANPVTLPGNLVGVTADRRWRSPSVNASHGMAWEVPIIAAGASRTVRSDGAIGPTPVDISWPPANGANIYIYADSFDLNDPNNATFVEIRETNENNNQAGPLIFSAGVGPISSGAPESAPPLNRPDLR